MPKMRIFSAVLSIISLVSGLIIYLFLRTDTYIHAFLSEHNVPILSGVKALEADGFLVDFLRYYFVDFLWGFSLAFALCVIVPQFSKKYVTASCAVSFLCGAAFEILQYFSLVNGTPDFADVFMYAAAAVICAVINVKTLKKRRLL